MAEKKKECPSCAMEVEARSRECPICGYEFTQTNPLMAWIAILLVVLFLLYAIL